MSSLWFDTPMMGTARSSEMPILILAVDFQGSSTVLLCVDFDGYLHTHDVNEVRSDLRYNLKSDEWYDAVAKAREELDG